VVGRGEERGERREGKGEERRGVVRREECEE
jgi:hypothetical protein